MTGWVYSNTLLKALCAVSLVPCQAEEPETPAVQLDQVLLSYFTEPDRRQRAKTAVQIAALVDNDVRRVADALGQLQLWDDQPQGIARIDVPVGQERSLSVEVLVPPGYDAKRRYPLILALHGAHGQGRHMIGYLQRLLGDDLDQFIVAAPTGYTPPTMLVPIEAADEPLDILAALRRRYHLDTNRVYVLGYSMGGHSAFGLATLYGDQFAAAIPLAGTLIVSHHQARAIVLSNLINTPVFACWGSEDKFDDRGKKAAGGGLAGLNRLIAAMAGELEVPLRGRQLPDIGHTEVMPPLVLLMPYLEMTRDPAPRRINHWFRYPAQGRSAWLRQTKFSGRPWEGTELTIVTRLGEDFDEYATKTIKRKLAFIGGSIEGQCIEVHTRRTAEINVLLNDELVDLDQPLVLELNGKKRHQGKVERKVTTMLELAYDDWDFQRLYSAKLIVGRRSMARQD